MVSNRPSTPKQKGLKYNKITQQKKFHLLTLIFKDRIPIREAASVAGINYLTAKTILFFHKNNCKSYRFEIDRPQSTRHVASLTASFSTIKKISDINEKLIKPKSRIEVICSIGNVLSPPKGEQVNSPTTCSNHQDTYITRPPPMSLEENTPIKITLPAPAQGMICGIDGFKRPFQAPLQETLERSQGQLARMGRKDWVFAEKGNIQI